MSFFSSILSAISGFFSDLLDIGLTDAEETVANSIQNDVSSVLTDAGTVANASLIVANTVQTVAQK